MWYTASFLGGAMGTGTPIVYCRHALRHWPLGLMICVPHCPGAVDIASRVVHYHNAPG